MIINETSTKIEKIYSDLKDRLNEMSIGTRFPSIREVMREYNVSQVTVDRAMELLSSEGLIVKQPKRGIFVTHCKERSLVSIRRTLAVAVPSYTSSIIETYLSAISSHIQSAGKKVEIIRYDWQDRVPRVLPNKKINGLVIVPTSVKLTPEDLYSVSRFNVPTVFISRLVRDVAIDCVEPDNEIGGELVAEHLVKLGHRKLAILMAEPPAVSGDQRISGFTRKAQMMGVTDIQQFCSKTVPGESSALKAYETLMVNFRKRKPTFTGLFVLSDGSALGALKALHDLEISVPGEVSVVGFDDIPEAQFYFPSLTTVRGAYDRVSQTAVDIIERRLSGDKTEAIQLAIPPKLIVRESTAGPASYSEA